MLPAEETHFLVCCLLPLFVCLPNVLLIKVVTVQM